MTAIWSDLSGIVTAARDAIIGLEFDGTIASWNIGAVEIFGHTPAEVLGRRIALLATDRSRDPQQTIERICAGDSIVPYHDALRRKGGEEFVGSIAVSPVLGADGIILGVSQIIRPVTDTVAGVPSSRTPGFASAHQLLRLEALAGGARCGGALVEELYQPITAIVAYLNSMRCLIARAAQQDSDRLSSAVNQAVKQASRAAKIVHQLSRFVSDVIEERQSIPLGALISEAQEQTSSAIQESGVNVEFRLRADALVSVDRVAIEQVFCKLLREILAAAVMTSSYRASVSTFLSATHVCVRIASVPSVQKTGSLAAAIAPDGGTGANEFFGLPLCHAVVCEHGGQLFQDIAPDGGMSFHCILPIARQITTFLADASESSPQRPIHPAA